MNLVALLHYHYLLVKMNVLQIHFLIIILVNTQKINLANANLKIFLITNKSLMVSYQINIYIRKILQ